MPFLFQNRNSPANSLSNKNDSQQLSTIPLNTSNYCFICKKNYLTSSEFMVHLRYHFINDKIGKTLMSGNDIPLNDLLYNRTNIDMANEELWT